MGHNIRLEEVKDPKERPWAVIAAPEGDACAGRFSVSILSFANLEIRVHLDREKGLFASGDRNDDQIFRNVASQGFKYGFVFGEHTCAAQAG